MARNTWRPLVVVPFVLTLVACGLFVELRLDKIEITADQVTLAWDPPEAAADAVPVASYRLYYRAHKSAAWILLTEVTATDAPEYTVTSTALTPDNYDFAVTSVGVNGLESEYHTSLDRTADPPSGWYLIWNPIQ